MRTNQAAELEQLYTANYPRLVAELTVLCGSRAIAEDCAQETFTRLVLHWNKVSRYERPVAWLRTVGYRLAIDDARRRRRLRPMLDPELQGGAAPDDVRLREVWQAVLDLPPLHSEVLVRHAALGLSDDEIAADLEVPLGTVKSRLSRARTALRTHLGEA